jgi:hypothetical protein
MERGRESDSLYMHGTGEQPDRGEKGEVLPCCADAPTLEKEEPMATHVAQPHTSTAHMIRRTCEALGVLGGAWLIAAPFSWALNFTGDANAAWSTVIVGIVVVCASLVAMYERVGSAISYATIAVAGVWAITAPYLLTWSGGSGSDSALNSIWMGIGLVLIALFGYAGTRADTEQ